MTVTNPAAPVVAVPTVVNVKDPAYGAKGDGVADDAAAITAALAALPAGGGDVFFPAGTYKHSTTIALTDGQRLIGGGALQRWRSASAIGVKLVYSGVGRAIRIANTAAVNRESVEIHNIRFDGTGLVGAVDGLFIDGTAGTANNYVEGVFFNNCAFTNFPRYQVLADGLIIDAVFQRCAFNNVGAPASFDLVHVQQTGVAPKVNTQYSFNECLFAQYGPNAWCANLQTVDARFSGGTVTTNGQAGGNGIVTTGALTLIGTHLESIGLAGIGIRYASAAGAFIAPDYCASWAEGIQVGDPGNGAQRANGCVIAGMISGNGAARDIHIINGGSRTGTLILGTGQSQGGPAGVTDDRAGIDGAFELTRLDINPATFANAVVGSSAGSTVGFYGHVAVARAAAYALAYPTASRALAADAIVDPAATAATSAGPYGYTQAQADAIRAAVIETHGELNNVRGVLRQLIADLQGNGLLQ